MTNDVQNTTSITTEGDTVIRMEREFDAPPELVWEAYTDPELLSEWLGPHGTKLAVEADVREGGSYRWKDEEAGIEFWGEYREVNRPEGARVDLRVQRRTRPRGRGPAGARGARRRPHPARRHLDVRLQGGPRRGRWPPAWRRASSRASRRWTPSSSG